MRVLAAERRSAILPASALLVAAPVLIVVGLIAALLAG
jgi:hypothetical protein